MSALATDYAPRQVIPPSFGTTKTWDPVTFRMASPTPSRAVEERDERTAGWTAGQRPLPEPAAWGAVVARTAIECLLGLRPVQQLSRWLDEPIYRALSRRAGLAARVLGPSRGRIASVRSQRAEWSDEHTVEVSTVLHDGQRCRAAALRLERYHGRWLVTALEIG